MNPENDLPVAVDDVATLNEDASAVINVLANDSDLDGDTLSLDSVDTANMIATRPGISELQIRLIETFILASSCGRR